MVPDLFHLKMISSHVTSSEERMQGNGDFICLFRFVDAFTIELTEFAACAI